MIWDWQRVLDAWYYIPILFVALVIFAYVYEWASARRKK